MRGFLRAAVSDPRMGAGHISLFLALFVRWQEGGCRSPLVFTSRDLMPLAKIAGRATYHRCLRDLVEGGYVQYQPSNRGAEGCRVWMAVSEKMFRENNPIEEQERL